MIVRVTLVQQAFTTLRLALPLYGASVVLAAGPVAIGMLGLASVAADRPWRAELLGPNWLNLTMELTAGAAYAGGTPGVAVMLLSGLILVPLAMFGQVVAYSFLAGGILERLSAPPGTAPAFWRGCRRWFWRSFRLSVLGGVIVVAVGALVATISSLAGRLIGPDQSAVLQIVAQAVVLGWLELARAVMVQGRQRSAGASLRRAARAVLRPLVLLVWLALALPPAGLVLAAGLPPAIGDPFSVGGILQALVYGQLVAFLSAWTKVIRLAVAVRLAEMIRPALTPASIPGPATVS